MALFLSFMIVIAVALVATLAYRSYRQKRTPTPAGLIAAIGIVDQPLSPAGTILVQGELWSARSSSGERVNSGSRVRVECYQDGVLLVRHL